MRYLRMYPYIIKILNYIIYILFFCFNNKLLITLELLKILVSSHLIKARVI